MELSCLSSSQTSECWMTMFTRPGHQLKSTHRSSLEHSSNGLDNGPAGLLGQSSAHMTNVPFQHIPFHTGSRIDSLPFQSDQWQILFAAWSCTSSPCCVTYMWLVLGATNCKPWYSKTCHQQCTWILKTLWQNCCCCCDILSGMCAPQHKHPLSQTQQTEVRSTKEEASCKDDVLKPLSTS